MSFLHIYKIKKISCPVNPSQPTRPVTRNLFKENSGPGLKTIIKKIRTQFPYNFFLNPLIFFLPC